MLKARRKRSKLSMTSLIDVIFLLLLFFMLTSTFTKFAEIELLSTAQGGSAEVAKTPPLFVQISADRMSLNAQSVTLGTIADVARSKRRAAGGQPVLVSLGSNASAQRLSDLLVALRRVPRLAITVLEART